MGTDRGLTRRPQIPLRRERTPRPAIVSYRHLRRLLVRRAPLGRRSSGKTRPGEPRPELNPVLPWRRVPKTRCLPRCVADRSEINCRPCIGGIGFRGERSRSVMAFDGPSVPEIETVWSRESVSSPSLSRDSKLIWKRKSRFNFWLVIVKIERRLFRFSN